MEDEDKESLQAVEDSEDIGDRHAVVVDEEVAKQPGETEQDF